MVEKLLKIYIKSREIVKYLIVGVLTTLVSLLVYYICVFTFLDPRVALELQIANVLSWIISVTFAYVTNRIIVFNSTNKKVVREYFLFSGARILTLLLDMGIMFLFVTVLHGNDKIFKIISQIFIMMGNYLISKLIIFRKNS